MKYIFSLAILLVASSIAVAQPKCNVVLLDGSRIYGNIIDTDLDVTTKYGKVTIPWKEVQHVKLGLHFPAGAKEEISKSLKKLDSPAHKEREKASASLFSLGRYAYLSISERAAKYGDPESKSRTELIKKKIEEELPVSEIRKSDHDLVVAREATLKGTLTGVIKIKTAHLGDIDLKLCTIDSLALEVSGGPYTVDASKHGMKPVQWFDTHLQVSSSSQWTLVATGTVDVWSQTAGQYLSSPKGLMQNATVNEGFVTGGLIGKVGENGKEFLVGDRYISGSSSAQDVNGKLYLRINPSPWAGGIMSGSYEVRVEGK